MRAGAAVLGAARASFRARRFAKSASACVGGKERTRRAKSEIHSVKDIYSTSVGHHAVYIGAMNTARPSC